MCTGLYVRLVDRLRVQVSMRAVVVRMPGTRVNAVVQSYGEEGT